MLACGDGPWKTAALASEFGFSDPFLAAVRNVDRDPNKPLRPLGFVHARPVSNIHLTLVAEPVASRDPPFKG